MMNYLKHNFKRIYHCFPFAFSLIIYLTFAILIFIAQGSHPELVIDHIYYFQTADDLASRHQDGQYWKSFNSAESYAVLMAYLYKATGSHVLSFKFLLAALTVAYLFAFQLLMSLATNSRALAILFSIMSAFFVSFGGSIWGVTEFSAALPRTIVLPLLVFSVWFFLRWHGSLWCYAIFPALTVFSLLHLSAYYLFSILLVVEGLDVIFRRNRRLDRRIAYLVVALILSAGIQAIIEHYEMGVIYWVEPMLQNVISGETQQLTPKQAWEIELYAMPWANLPLHFTTLANMGLSFGVIFLLSVAGAIRAFRCEAKPLDHLMLLFTVAVLVTAYGLQTILLVVRQLAPIYPVNFQEMRAVNFIMIPATYFTFRLYEGIGKLPGALLKLARLAVIAAFILQPILLLRMLPDEWRGQILAWAIDAGFLRQDDTPRMLYARYYLGLTRAGPRFYYATLPLIEWLKHNGRPGDRILTDLNEISLAGYLVIGSFDQDVQFRHKDPVRLVWKREVEAVGRALASGDTETVLATARQYGATIAIVPWVVVNADYRDEYFSLIRIQ